MRKKSQMMIPPSCLNCSKYQLKACFEKGSKYETVSLIRLPNAFNKSVRKPHNKQLRQNKVPITPENPNDILIMMSKGWLVKWVKTA